jgi:hypothetical protein
MSKSRLALSAIAIVFAACGSSSPGTTTGTGGSGGTTTAGQGGGAGMATGGASAGGAAGTSTGGSGVVATGNGGSGVVATGNGGSGVVATGNGGSGVVATGNGGNSAGPGIVNNISRCSAIAVDDTTLYYFTEITVDIMRTPKDGSGTPASTFTSGRQPISIVADASGIYWTEDGSSTTDGAIRTCPPSGCPATPATLASAEPTPGLIAIDGTFVYWNNGINEINSAKKDGSVGGAVIYHATGNAATVFYSMGGLAVDASNVFFTSAGIPPTSPGGTWICPIGGCGSAQPVMIGSPAGKVALDSTHIFTIGSTSGVLQTLKNGTSPVVINPTLAGTAVATDGVNVYWADGTAINKCAVGGCASPTPVATIASPVRTIVLDTGYVYWAEWGIPYPPAPGVIRRAAK